MTTEEKLKEILERHEQRIDSQKEFSEIWKKHYEQLYKKEKYQQFMLGIFVGIVISIIGGLFYLILT